MHALVYCKTFIVSVPSILSIRASGAKYSMLKILVSDDVILSSSMWSVFVLVQWILVSILSELR